MGVCLWLLQHHVLVPEIIRIVNNKSLCAAWARMTDAVPWCAVYWGRHWTSWFELEISLLPLRLIHPQRRTGHMPGVTVVKGRWLFNLGYDIRNEEDREAWGGGLCCVIADL